MAKRRRNLDRRTATRNSGRAPSVAASPQRGRRGAGPILVAAVVIIVGAFVVFGGGLLGPAASPSPTANPTREASAAPTAGLTETPSPSPTGAPTLSPISSGPPVISGVACEVDERTTYHVHAHLNIRFDGELQAVPADVGIGDGCLFWLHTHAPYGVIHVEAPAETAFTLGQFMDVWGQPLSTTQVLSRTVGSGESLFVYVDRLKYEGDPRGIVLGNLVAIELQVGPAPLEPLPYTFPAEFQ